jgi:hypothetical protein
MKNKKRNKETEEKVVFKRRFIEEIMDLIDRDFVLIQLAVLLVGFSLIHMVIEVPPVEVQFVDNRFTSNFDHKFIITPDEEPEVEKVKEEKRIILEKEIDGIDSSQSRKTMGEEGRVGEKTSKIANAQGSARKTIDEKVAVSSGIIGVLSSGAKVNERVFGGGALGAGLERNLGQVAGLSGVDQFGTSGLGTRGFGTGGGGNALSIGNMGTRGRGGNPGNSYGMAQGTIGRKGRSEISAGDANTVVMGAIERSVIDAYIRRNLAKIRWCYERELAKDPVLLGRIVINFTISGTGVVSQSKVNRTTMGNQTVESCVANQIRTIRFPPPKGGGIVIVNYPFVFKSNES